LGFGIQQLSAPWQIQFSDGLRELPGRFGLSHPDSASDLIKLGIQQAKQNRNTARKVTSIERALGLNTESHLDPRSAPSDRGAKSLRTTVTPSCLAKVELQCTTPNAVNSKRTSCFLPAPKGLMRRDQLMIVTKVELVCTGMVYRQALVFLVKY
jgi:hypothetical protein